MGRSLPLFLTRVAAMVAAGLLLFAVFGQVHAQDRNRDDNYGLKRFPGDVIKVHNTIFSDVVFFLSPFSGVAATAAVIQ